MKYSINTPEHDEIVGKLQKLADNVNGTICSDYSGRGMYGACCYGIDCDDDIALLMKAGNLNLPRPRIDSMGQGIIAYWPQIEGREESL